MKQEQYQEMYQQYKKGFSLAEVGKMYGVTRQSVYAGFKCRKYKLRTKKKLPFQIFNGIKFTLRNQGYYARTDGQREQMHRYVWEFYNGELPKDYDIHHIDENRTNNNINNLEAMSKSEHTRRYSKRHNQYTKRNNINGKD